MEKISENKIEKPEVLYHGSTTPDLEQLEPKQIHWRDKEEGPRIFATPDKRLATIFAGKNEKVIRSGKFDDTPYAVIIGTPDEFIEQDKGGYIYTLPSDNFESDPEKGMGASEWTSDAPIKPIKSEHFDSALDEMIKAGVQVYFIDHETNGAISKSKDHGYAIMKNLRSENQRRGMNVIDF